MRQTPFFDHGSFSIIHTEKITSCNHGLCNESLSFIEDCFQVRCRNIMVNSTKAVFRYMEVFLINEGRFIVHEMDVCHDVGGVGFFSGGSGVYVCVVRLLAGQHACVYCD